MPKDVYYIPNGPKNLQPLFTTSFLDVAEYFIELKDSAGTVIATTPITRMFGCDPEDYVRLHFLNRLGCIDAIDLMISDVSKETKADTSERPTSAPLVKSQHAVNRFNVRSNDTYTAVTTDYTERDMAFIDECLESPLHWIQWVGTQGQVDDYIPVVLNDQKTQKRKLEDRFTYEIYIEFKLSHEKFTLRN